MYEFIGDQYYLGAKSYKTNLVSVSWYLAKDSNNIYSFKLWIWCDGD